MILCRFFALLCVVPYVMLANIEPRCGRSPGCDFTVIAKLLAETQVETSEIFIKQVNQLKAELAAIKIQVETSKFDFETKLATTNAELNTTKMEMTTVTNELTSVKDELSAAKTKSHKSETKIKDLKSRIESVFPELTLIKEEQTTIQSTVSTIQTQQTSINSTISVITDRQGEAKAGLTSMKTLQTILKSELRAVKSQQNDLTKKIGLNRKSILTVESSSYQGCSYTVSGPIPYTSCHFPFKYGGKTYKKCTRDHHKDNKPWCTTSVDAKGEHIGGKWGTCHDHCA